MPRHPSPPLTHCLQVLACLFHNSKDAILIANSDHQIIQANSYAHQLFRDRFDILINPPRGSSSQLFNAETEQPIGLSQSPLRRVLQGEVINDAEMVLRGQTNRDIWLSVSGFPVPAAQDLAGGAVLIIRDISERQHKVLQQLRASRRDRLTGLPGRSLLTEKIGEALAQMDPSEAGGTAVLYFDIERFKAISDTLGHAVGNELLLQLVSRVQACLTESDVAARIGRDEFAVLLAAVRSQQQLIEVVEQLTAQLAEPFAIDDHEVCIHTKIGIDFSGTCRCDPEDLLANAGTAMRQAKESAGKEYCIFDQSMRQYHGENLRLELELRRAIRNGEIIVYYQPIVVIQSQKIVGFEALVRWNHPTRGLLAPNHFIPLAEESGLIIPLGWHVLKESCRQLKIWQDKFPEQKTLFMSVNMSSKQFAPDDTVERIQATLSEVGLAGKHLKIEITEGVLIAHSASIIQKLGLLRQMGIQLSIDDFGTGYSSLSYLHQFPFDTLKLDRSFIEDADSDYEKLEIMQSVVRLAWNLGLEVVAEGIETQKHYAQLRGLRCELGQGYLFARPLAQDAAEALLSEAPNGTLGR